MKRVKQRYFIDLHTAQYLETIALEQDRDPEQVAKEIMVEELLTACKPSRVSKSGKGHRRANRKCPPWSVWVI